MMPTNFKYFVLLANMRTGSNLFEQNIRLYDEFSCHGELFNPHFIGYPEVRQRYGISMSEREKKPLGLLSKMVAQEKGTLPGFRLFADHDRRVLDDCLSDPECAKIVLSRNPIDSFVSHQIAIATDQWKLTDVRKRKKVKVDFDFDDFKAYLNRLNEYQAHIQNRLQRFGQAAFYLRYDDLNNVEIFNGLAGFLGGKEQRKELQKKIVRQNPEGLEEKVNNFNEMREQLMSLDPFSVNSTFVSEPPRNPGSKSFTAGETVPVLIMPMRKGGDKDLVDWLERHETAGAGKGSLETTMNQKQLAEWLNGHPERQSIVVLGHPLQRAYDAFYRHIFCGGDDLFPWIRSTLETHYDMDVPDTGTTKNPNRQVLENLGYDAGKHREAFHIFLRFLKGNLQGQTRARIDQSWASQNSILQGFSRLVFPDLIIRKENLTEDIQLVESRLGLGHIPLKASNALAPCFTLEEIYTLDLEKTARQVYARDYQMFGFSNWKPG